MRVDAQASAESLVVGVVVMVVGSRVVRMIVCRRAGECRVVMVVA